MPNRPMRLNPGQNTNSGGGKLDLGSILLGIFGGVGENPDYAKSEGPDQGSGEGIKGDFYKPRSIFNNAEAAEMNAQFNANQLLDRQAEARTNRLADATIPREVYRRNSIDPLDLAKRQAENNQDVNKQAQLGTQSNFSRAGLLNLSDLPQAADMTQKNNLEEVAANQNLGRINSQTGVNNATLGYDLQNQTTPFKIRQALATAQGGAVQAEGDLTNLPAEIKSRGIIARENPLWKAIEVNSQATKVGQPGDTFYNTALGKSVGQVPITPMQQMINNSITKLNTSPQGQNPQPNPPTAIPAPQEIDPSKLVRIGGKLYIRH